jgi:hypothetical protein
LPCNCGNKYCHIYHNASRKYVFEDSYTLYLEKIGALENSWVKSGTKVAEAYPNSNGDFTINFDSELIGEKITLLNEKSQQLETFKLKELTMSFNHKSIKVDAVIENGNFHFGNVFESKIRDEVNKALNSNFQEQGVLRPDDFTAINLDGLDIDYYAPILEIKTCDQNSFAKDPKAAIRKYYAQINRYIDVYYENELIQSKKAILAVYLKPKHTQHLTKKDCETMLNTFDTDRLHIFEVEADPNYNYTIKDKIERFKAIIEHFKATGEVLPKETYNMLLFGKYRRKMGAKKIK